ncbi:DUF3016 domain-containing protein [Alteromonas sp. a30]|uniref:DUF3016 domain-containing protein n=1 Tax=Alteromonas sp. a30 TaxID=2730917 RepID=UPI00227E8570|nr:DUF3016 domain-containing protein [Alteromonas sp. a30]MCY7294664.1 DUF3016 domain-containing protein [Alteromonas sp. a30]
MNKLVISLLCGLSLSFLTQAADNTQEKPAGRATIEWQNPDEYVDVRPSNQSKKRFQTSTFNKLEAFVEKLAEALPEGQTLSMTVTNLDLAGHVWPGHMAGMNSTQEIRVIKRVDIPRMYFSYQLFDANGKVIKEGEEELKDMSFQERNIGRIQNDSLRYEKNMLERWFNKTLMPTSAEN